MRSADKLKYCPKCGAQMMDDWVKSVGGWIIRWWCICGYQMEERSN